MFNYKKIGEQQQKDSKHFNLPAMNERRNVHLMVIEEGHLNAKKKKNRKEEIE